MARKTILTPELQKQICDMIRATGIKKDAALLAGIGESTFYSWIEKGKRRKSGKYVEFVESVEKAQTQFKNALIASIRKSGRGTDTIKPQWQANAWLAERMFPDEFSLRIKTENENNTTVKFEITGNCSPDEI